MSKLTVNVWERDFALDVVYDRYEGEEILSSQQEALERFLASPDLIAEAKGEVERYCLSRNADEIGTSFIENIFKYVIPKSIYIQRTNDDTRVVGLLCSYKFDMSNGIAVVYKNEQLEKVGTQNIIL